jgi:hypothetical protein
VDVSEIPPYTIVMEYTDLMTPIRAQRGLMFRLSKELDIWPSKISGWTRVPAELVPEVERISGISRQILRPDLWPPSDSEAAQ